MGIDTGEFVSTLAEVHALVVGLALGVAVAVVSGLRSGHIADARNETAYAGGGFVAGFFATRLLRHVTNRH